MSQAAPNHARITDVAPRDGLQNEPSPVPVERKLELIERIAAAGPDEIELTSFVSPKWVPQLADAAEVVERAAALLAAAEPAPLGSVLVPNERGFESALAHHDAWRARTGRPLKIALFTAASEAFNKKNTNATVAESVERFRPIVPRAVEAGMPIRLYISTVVACPFSGSVEPAAVVRVVELLRGLFDEATWHADPFSADRPSAEIDLGETIGVARPEHIDALLGELERAFGSAIIERLTLHLHDTEGHAVDCVRAAARRGVRSFDAASGGLGGCPYASTPERGRAPGNIAMADLLAALDAEGILSRVDRAEAQTASACAAAMVSR